MATQIPQRIFTDDTIPRYLKYYFSNLSDDSINMPSADEKDALAGTTGTPSSTNKYITNNDSRIPTAGQKAALPGTAGTPSATNKYVTDQDTRLDNVIGNFTMAAAATKTINDTNITADSIVLLQATNGAANTLMAGANRIDALIADYVVGVSFMVRTAGGGAAAGTETFRYLIKNP